MLQTRGAVAMQADDPSVAVVMVVAAREDADPTELSPPLNDVVDPDALDAVLDGADADTAVSFTYQGYEVEVRGDGRVVLER